MTKVITVTPNPSLDRTLFSHYMAVGYHNTVTETTRLDPAGRGVNISRALYNLQCETHAVVMLGDDAIGKAYQALITEEAFPVKLLKRSGLTRSNTIILDTGQNTETLLIEESAGGTGEVIDHVVAVLAEMISPDDLVVLGGSLPGGIPSESYARLVETIQQASGKAVMISSGDSMRPALVSNPAIISLLDTELETFFKFPIRSEEDIIYGCTRMCEQGVGMALVVQQNRERIYLITEQETWVAELSDNVQLGTTSGVQEAMVAGFLSAIVLDKPVDAALKLGAAAAMYTRSQAGNEFGTLDDLGKLLDEVTVSQIAPQAS